MRKILKRIIGRILTPIYRRYSSKIQIYRYGRFVIEVLPGVFHPGLFLSTKFLLEQLKPENIKDKGFLELGAGSGLISVYAASREANVTALDISHQAIKNCERNALINNVKLSTCISDLFDAMPIQHFDYVIINPPYYPQNPKSESEYAWYCGERFDYFEKLFNQLGNYINSTSICWIIFSEDCDIKRINKIAAKYEFEMRLLSQKKFMFEWNSIYHIKKIN